MRWHQLISGIFLCAAFLMNGCAKPSAMRRPASFSADSASSGVIGGQPVSPQSVFSQKVLYLALGVSMKSDSSGNQSVNWSGHCTASAIAPRILLTAAHCVTGQTPADLFVVLTPNPETEAYQPADWIAVKTFKFHEGYTGDKGYLNDVALILLSKDVPASALLKLANLNQVPNPFQIVTIGYGITSDSSDHNLQMQSSQGLNFVMKTVENFSPQANFFSIDQSDHKGFCSGDSGGPGLIYDSTRKEFFIAGIVSNTSMNSEQKSIRDPKGIYSLCIGDGNYTNLLNPELKSWVEKNLNQLH